eukprot:CAMPEP_0181517868 /NCGR_PEP_ID=MMETSP1110-20121109/64941_1 /TAXON_ID=174948 /ORGANISM="Symbiodinium sp., Strain CCMP421" /LENGTH=46 /DNA_ID= /DNA_START= /DNA_END= /DNA_ORIENTATION=
MSSESPSADLTTRAVLRVLCRPPGIETKACHAQWAPIAAATKALTT